MTKHSLPRPATKWMALGISDGSGSVPTLHKSDFGSEILQNAFLCNPVSFLLLSEKWRMSWERGSISKVESLRSHSARKRLLRHSAACKRLGSRVFIKIFQSKLCKCNLQLKEVQSQNLSKDQEKFEMGAFIILEITLRFCPSALMIMIAIGTQLMSCLGSNTNDKGGSMPKIWTIRTRWYFGCFLCLITIKKKVTFILERTRSQKNVFIKVQTTLHTNQTRAR